jgi:hypothetical protein
MRNSNSIEVTTEHPKGKNSSVGTNAKEVRERAAVLQQKMAACYQGFTDKRGPAAQFTLKRGGMFHANRRRRSLPNVE